MDAALLWGRKEMENDDCHVAASLLLKHGLVTKVNYQLVSWMEKNFVAFECFSETRFFCTSQDWLQEAVLFHPENCNL